MKDHLIGVVNSLYKGGGFQYVLSQYVDRNYWANVICRQKVSINVDNMTDFNYSTCHTMFLHSASDPRIRVGNKEFGEYLKRNPRLDGVLVQISVIAPYAVIKYWRYKFGQAGERLQESFVPFDHESKMIGERIYGLLVDHGLTILDEHLLEIEVPGISLELREEHVTVYHCLFEDSY